jgi:LysR family transcriptional regulator for metE and metH
MMFELKHLKTIATLAKTGSVRKTAEVLFLSQSALSHQLKELESRLSCLLFIRNSQPIEFTPQGSLLLTLAKKVLPEIDRAEEKLKNKHLDTKHLKVAIACHACFQWLLPITESLKQKFPHLHIEFIDGVFSLPCSQQTELLFTDEKHHDDKFTYVEIGHFEIVAVMPIRHQWSHKKFINCQDFADEVLLTYPVEKHQLDIFTLFLNNEAIIPKKIKQVNNSHVMLQMIAAEMGVAALPNWLIKSMSIQSLVHAKPLGKSGIFKTLYARYEQTNSNNDIIEQLISEAATAFADL